MLTWAGIDGSSWYIVYDFTLEKFINKPQLIDSSVTPNIINADIFSCPINTFNQSFITWGDSTDSVIYAIFNFPESPSKVLLENVLKFSSIAPQR